MGEGSRTSPKWIYRDRRPANDDTYFENLTRVIFSAGLGWRMIDQKWSNFQKVFQNFVIDEVARFGEKDIAQLMGNPGIVRNRAKIKAAIANAKRMQDIRKHYGSIQSYLNSLDKSNNYALAIKILGKRFSRLGPSSARIFLYSIGENVQRPME